MKRNLSLILLLIIVISANAQWKVTSVDKISNKDNKLVQIVETDQSVIIYGVFDQPVDETTYYNIPRKTKVEVNGESYNIKNSINIPIYDDGSKKWAILEPANHKVNYLMEFEKFPVADGFSIVSANTDESSIDFNISGIHIEKIDSSDIIKPEQFIDLEKSSIKGEYSKDGKDFVFYKRQKVFVNVHLERYNKDFLYFIEIVNESDHDINFDFENVNVTAYKEKGEGNKEDFNLVRYTKKKLENEFKAMDYLEADSIAGGLQNIATAAETAHIVGDITKSIDRATGTLLSSIALGTRIAGMVNVSKYMKEHPKAHPEVLQSKSIKSGESYVGCVGFKYKKSNTQILHLIMEGNDYTMCSAIIK